MRIKLMVLGLASVIASWQVHADEMAVAPDAAAEPAAAAERVVISGDKLKRTEIDSSASVGARNRRQIAESGNTTLENVAAQMANVGTASGLSIRGINSYGPAGGGGGRTITLVVDGVTQDGYGQDISGLSVWDADRVEVLRGPQSTNQGRNSLAGAVVLKTRDPSDTPDFSYRVSAGNQNARRIAVAGGGAIVDQVLAGRISLEQRKRDGDVYDPSRADQRYNHDDGHTLRAKLRVTPIGDRYQALVTLVDDKQQLGSPGVEPVTRPAEARQNLSNEPRNSTNHTRSAALEQTFKLGGADITLLTTYSHNRYTRVQDYDGTELNQGYRTGENIDRQFSQEARANFETTLFGNQLKGVAGVYYLNAHYSGDDVFTVPVSYVLGLIGQCRVQSACDAAYGAEFIKRGNLEADTTRTRAAFTELDYAIGRLTLTAGMRFDGERQTRVLTGSTSGTSPLATRIVGQLINGGVFAADGAQNLKTDNDVWLPKLGLRYALAPEWVAGLTAQRGYRTGGVDYSYQRGSHAYAPEFTKNYEASLKGMLDGGMVLTLNAYRVDWSDQQVDVGRNTLDTYIVNAGSSRLQGLEAELRGKVTPHLELFGALGVSASRFLDFKTPQGDYTGKEFSRSPRQTQSVGVNWTPGHWTLNATLEHAGGTYTRPENIDRNDGHTILGGKAAYTLSNGMSLFAFGSNLTNRTYITANRLESVTGRYLVNLGNARQVGFGLQGSI
ncbi:TonB-dependent receptor [Janthinobacterium agaricidamnosum]|uniref:TonB-dependent Receptor Plug domain protein n=1 Tax=Janthinobacterium agaricidamnosum NBRC 102515 = DSM 9628 TaxID=1349767 RepID=W0V0D8_9BURK|nr:TonB-dependent receptor [Janthinobacterium agaricidamnosum]CDG81336.1 tonB-dependent Receptor Plug domain protein [Janthinobacterium agaricidamnosum NBRC 102515 = DSM 9628]